MPTRAVLASATPLGYGSLRLEDTTRRLTKARERGRIARKAFYADTSGLGVCDAQVPVSQRLEDTTHRLAKARERGRIARKALHADTSGLSVCDAPRLRKSET